MIKSLILLFAAFLFIIPLGYPVIHGNSDSSVSATFETQFDTYISWLFENLDKGAHEKPEFEPFKKAATGFFQLKEQSKTKKNTLVLIDFSLSSNSERMWIIDLDKMQVVNQTLVSHGQNSGELYAEKFSNTPSSYQSSLGFFVTGEIYYGRHGMSLYLNGMESGINDKALKRTIVMHSADYVSREFIDRHGRLGRSHGCPAIPVENHEEVIQMLAGGTCLFIYHPTPAYIKKSELLDEQNAIAGMVKLLEETSASISNYSVGSLTAQMQQ